MTRTHLTLICPWHSWLMTVGYSWYQIGHFHSPQVVGNLISSVSVTVPLFNPPWTNMNEPWSGWWLGTFFFIYWERHHPNWLSNFSEGLIYHQPVILGRSTTYLRPIMLGIDSIESWKRHLHLCAVFQCFLCPGRGISPLISFTLNICWIWYPMISPVIEWLK